MIGAREIPYALTSFLNKKEKIGADELFLELNKRLDSGDPFIAGKIGGTELWALRSQEFSYSAQIMDSYNQLCNWSGFFSNNPDAAENMQRFTGLLKQSLASIDYLNRWEYSKDEYFVRKYCSKDVKDIDWLGLEYRGKPIGEILRRRKVLAVTPFDQEVRDQYAIRELVHSDKYLPEFSLKTYKAVQTIAGTVDPRFSDWFEALDYMCEGIADMDFDIALVGCGAYSIPICASIKKTGRSAVHLGGDLQLVFGIMGKRWEDDELINSLRNEHWIYPYESSKPKNLKQVEDGCYW